MATVSTALIVRPQYFEPRTLTTFFLQEYEPAHRKDWTATTRRTYLRSVKIFDEFFGRPSIGAIADEHMIAFERKLILCGFSESATKNYTWLMFSVLNAASPERFPTAADRALVHYPKGAPRETFEYEFTTTLFPKLAAKWGGLACRSLYSHVGRFTKWRGKFTPIDELSEKLICDHEQWACEAGYAAKTVATIGQKLRMLVRMIDGNLCRERLRPYRTGPTVRISAINSRIVTVSQYASESYAVTRQLDKKSEYHLLHSVQHFEDYLAKQRIDSDIEKIDELLLSGWIKSLELLYAPRTIRSMRGAVLGVVQDAADAGLRPNLRSKRVRLPKVPAPVAKAWPRETIERLIMASRKLPGKINGRLPAALYFEAIIRAAWCLAIRKGDLLSLRMTDILPDGRVFIIQRKTKTKTNGRLGAGEIELLKRLGKPQPLAWPFTQKGFYDWMDKVKKLAGVDERGHLHRIRKSAATDVASRNRSDATKLLGHTTAWADPFYIDETLLNHQPVEPSQLQLPALAIGGAA